MMFGRNKLFFHSVCACARFHKFPCSMRSMHDANVFRQFHKFPDLSEEPNSLCKRFHRSLVNGTFFLSPQKQRSVSLGFPDRSLIGLGFGWVLGERCALNFSTRLLNEFSNWLLFNCRTQLIIPSGPIVIVSQ